MKLAWKAQAAGKSLVAILAVASALGVATVATAQQKKTLVFVVNGASDFWKIAEAGVKKAQGELPKYTLQFKYPEQAAAAVQQRVMEDLVAAGVAGIMVSSVDPKNQTDGLNKIAGQTMLFTTDSDAPKSKRVAYIGSSNVELGKDAGKLMLKALPQGGKCIGFVGLLVPHLVRPLVRHRPDRLLIPSALAGASLVCLADMAVRLLPPGRELKLGVLTALIGAPLFIWLVWKERKQWI